MYIFWLYFFSIYVIVTYHFSSRNVPDFQCSKIPGNKRTGCMSADMKPCFLILQLCPRKKLTDMRHVTGLDMQWASTSNGPLILTEPSFIDTRTNHVRWRSTNIYNFLIYRRQHMTRGIYLSVLEKHYFLIHHIQVFRQPHINPLILLSIISWQEEARDTELGALERYHSVCTLVILHAGHFECQAQRRGVCSL